MCFLCTSACWSGSGSLKELADLKEYSVDLALQSYSTVKLMKCLFKKKIIKMCAAEPEKCEVFFIPYSLLHCQKHGCIVKSGYSEVGRPPVIPMKAAQRRMKPKGSTSQV